jgi:hypothetical protein
VITGFILFGYFCITDTTDILGVKCHQLYKHPPKVFKSVKECHKRGTLVVEALKYKAKKSERSITEIELQCLEYNPQEKKD